MPLNPDTCLTPPQDLVSLQRRGSAADFSEFSDLFLSSCVRFWFSFQALIQTPKSAYLRLKANHFKCHLYLIMKSVLVCIGFCFAFMSLFYFEGYFLCGVLFEFVLSCSLIDFSVALSSCVSALVSFHT